MVKKKQIVPHRHPLVRLHRGPQLSQKALTFLLKDIRDNGSPSALSTRSQRRWRHEAAVANTPYGLLLQSLAMDEGDTYVFHPMAMLHETICRCESFRSLFRQTLQKHHVSFSRPWRLILYCDEVTPTDPVSVHVDTHKIQCIYWTFMEFSHIIWDDDLWFIAAVVPSVQVHKQAAGMSQLVRDSLRKFFSTRLRPTSKPAA